MTNYINIFWYVPWYDLNKYIPGDDVVVGLGVGRISESLSLSVSV